MQNIEIAADFVPVGVWTGRRVSCFGSERLPAGTTQHTFKETTVMQARALVDRVRGEFNEMPGLQLTIPQAARLLGIEHEACRDVIETLVASSFLRRTSAGMVVRAER